MILNDLQTEQALIGSMVLDPQIIGNVATEIEVTDFYDRKCQKIFSAMVSLYNKDKGIDPVMIWQESKISSTEINKYLNSVATSSKWKDHAIQIKEYSAKRKIMQIMHENTKNIDKTPLDEAIAHIQDQIFSVNTATETQTTDEVVTAIEETQRIYAEKYEQGQKTLGISCGMEKLDNLIDGLRPGHLWVIGAWSSTGKTQFALNILHNVIEQGIPASMISLEMDNQTLAARMIGLRHNMSAIRVLRGRLEGRELDNINEGKMFLRKTEMYMYDNISELSQITTLIRKDAKTKGIKVAIVDYAQLIVDPGSRSEYELMTKVPNSLRILAGKLGITIILVSQISNESQKGSGAGAGFKGSGALEAAADLGIRLKRDRDKEHPQADYIPMQIQIKKNRHGLTGVIHDYSMWLKSGKFTQEMMPWEALNKKGYANR